MRAEITHFHLFAGIGGGAEGFDRGEARVGRFEAVFRCLGGVDVDPAACADFERRVRAPATCLDLMDREQYQAFHGQEPPDGWREASPDDIRRAAGGERPDIVFTSPPCKGFSGLISERSHKSARYQALNRLTLRGVWLALEAWADDPPEFFLLENVPRIATRGRRLLDEITALLEHYGYATAETTHDCGELGGLGQRRQRFLLVARHREQVPPHLYEPARRPLQGVGEVIGGFGLPGDPAEGPLHAIRRLQWKTWVRLAFIPAGGDHRDLRKLVVEDGYLRDLGIIPEAHWYAGPLGVADWHETSCTVTSEAHSTTGRFSVADPRPSYTGDYAQLGVTEWGSPSTCVTCQRSPGQGRFSVQDPRIGGDRVPFNNVYRVIDWREAAGCVTAGSGPSAGGQAVADPRPTWHPDAHLNKLKVIGFADPCNTVTGAQQVGSGAASVADPRLTCDPRRGAYGVVPWEASAGAVIGHASHDNSASSVADPRLPGGAVDEDLPELPAADERLECVIRALDGTWHRPFTTKELAALQGLVEPGGDPLALAGTADSRHRERIGNAVPPPAAAAIAGVMGRAILLARTGETFALGSTPVWVRPLAIAASVDLPEVIS